MKLQSVLTSESGINCKIFYSFKSYFKCSISLRVQFERTASKTILATTGELKESNTLTELKIQILRFDVKPGIVDKFVVIHLKSIESNFKLFRSVQIRSFWNNDIKLLQSNRNVASKSHYLTNSSENFENNEKTK